MFLRISFQCTKSSHDHTTWTCWGSPSPPGVVAHDTKVAPASVMTAMPKVLTSSR